MSVELKVPAVGESITEVQIGEWLVREGDLVQADEPLVVIETDKVTVELPAPAAGVIAKTLKKRGDKAEVGEVIGILEERAGAAPAAEKEPSDAQAKPSKAAQKPHAGSPAKPGAAKAPAASAPVSKDKQQGKERARDAGEAEPGRPPARTAPQAEQDVRVMPAARRALAERGLRPSEVRASGPGGRLLKEDVERDAADDDRSAADQDRYAGRGAPAKRAEPAPRATLPPAAEREEESVPMSPLRKRIAQRLVEAQQTAAILTTFNEIDMSVVGALRRSQQERFLQKHGVKLGFMSFFVKASIEALKLVPQVNAEVRGDAIVYKNYFDIGIAVGGGKGLVVPVLRDAERLSFAEIEVGIADLAARAKDNELALEELQGGTFTISNGGIYGSLLSTPILNPPQSGILGLHAIQERAVVREGAVVVRPMMFVALSYDHRIVDGREAVTFLKHVKELVEEPARLLLEI